MPIDCLNDKIPVYDPDEGGCYEWMSVKAGKPSKFCDDVTVTGETPEVVIEGCIDGNFNPPLPPAEGAYYATHPLVMTMDKSFYIEGTSQATFQPRIYNGLVAPRFRLPEVNRGNPNAKSSFNFNEFIARPIPGEQLIEGNSQPVFAEWNDSGVLNTTESGVSGLPHINIYAPGNYRMSFNIAFYMDSSRLTNDFDAVANGTSPGDNKAKWSPELLLTCSNYRNAPATGAVPADHITLWRNARVTDNFETAFLSPGFRKFNREFTVSPQLLEANGGVVKLCFFVAFKDNGKEDPEYPANPTPFDPPPSPVARSVDFRRDQGFFLILGKDDGPDASNTLDAPLSPGTDSLWDPSYWAPGPAPPPYPRLGIPRTEKKQTRNAPTNFILEWLSEWQDPSVFVPGVQPTNGVSFTTYAGQPLAPQPPNYPVTA
jgi:hypothetical protein